MKSMLRYNFLLLELIAIILAITAICTSSWEKVVLKDTDAVQAIYHSPLLTTMVSDRSGIHIDFHNATGYVLEIRTGLMDICTRLRQPHARSFETSYCKRTIARPAIGLAIVGVIFLVIGTVCTIFTDEDNLDHREICWLSYSSAVFIALGGLLLFTSHWTYSISSELQLPSIYIRYGYSTYLLVVAAVISLLSMSLVLWRLYLRRVYSNQQPQVNSTKRRKFNHRRRSRR